MNSNDINIITAAILMLIVSAGAFFWMVPSAMEWLCIHGLAHAAGQRAKLAAYRQERSRVISEMTEVAE